MFSLCLVTGRVFVTMADALLARLLLAFAAGGFLFIMSSTIMRELPVGKVRFFHVSVIVLSLVAALILHGHLSMCVADESVCVGHAACDGKHGRWLRADSAVALFCARIDFGKLLDQDAECV